MRPIRLVLQAWGPFAGREEVDFRKLSGNMFLITGPTGSGKTTIFDGIAYALYGNVSGSIRERNGLRSDFAGAGTESCVELEFLQGGQRYQIRRTPRYERPKKRGEGTVTSPETAVLVLPEGETVSALAEVNRRVEELLGMNYGQFRQLAMIAQGEFMDLLVQNSPERVEILRSVFQTGIYEKLQKRLSEESRSLYQEAEALKNRMTEAVGSIRAEEGQTLYELKQAENLHYEAITEELKSVIRKTVREEKQLAAEQEKEQAEAEKLAALLREAEQRKQRLAEKKRLEEKLAELRKEQPEREEQRKMLERVRAAEQVQVKELPYRLAERRCLEAEEALDGLQREWKAWESRFQTEEKEQEEQEQRKERLQELTERRELLEQLLRLVREQEKAEQQTERLRTAYEAAEQELLVKKEQYETKERHYRDAVIGRAAGYLREGQPCPVCGSLEHPAPAKLPEETPDEAQVEEARQIYEKHHTSCQELLQKIAAQNAVVREKERQQEELWNRLNTTGVTGMTAADMAEAAEKIQKEAQRLQTEWKQKQGELEQCVSMRQTLQARQEEWTKVAEQSRQEREHAREEYRTELERQGFVSEREQTAEDEYRKFCLTPETKQEMESVLAEYEKLQLETETQYRVLTEELERQQSSEIGRELAAWEQQIQNEQPERDSLQEQLEEAAGQIRERLSQGRELLEKARLDLQVNRAAEKSLTEKLGRRKVLQERYGVMQDLARAASGNNREHLVLEQYILSVYLEEIIRLANLRLAPMTMGRYELAKVERVTDARTRDYLGLEILDAYTGKRRSVKSLSGGESFKAALSLALGLADMIQSYAGGIEIDMLFIDEGFGSLDEESLDQAVSTLYRLAGEHKSIGIISHVTELKERLRNQVVIQKTPTGSHICQ